MKTIIVAMDFSQGATNALDYAIDIAQYSKAEILLVWIDTYTNEKAVMGEKNEVRHDAKLELQNIVDKNKEKHPELDISFKQKKGKVFQEIANIATTTKADLIVVGTHGVSGFEEFWIGSNAYKIISYAPCPVISVPTKYATGGKIEKIIVPIDDSFDTTRKIPMASQLAVAFQASIELLGVYHSKLTSIKKITDGYIKDSERYLNAKGIPSKFKSCSSNNIATSIVKYAEEINADLIVIMTDQNNANTDIILGVNSQHIINNSNIPILSVKPEKLKI
ncbi:MAG: hypothetical protein B7C24_01350 [Bacteroidetes bacterium 4572_77]|nr:MAG: hypothetical protein B7C24_01350 [Bacteroidetes bacterium 4572_77]